MTDLIDGEPRKQAKESSCRTVLYYHECPYCGDPCEDYETSMDGQEMECVCGKKYDVVKKGKRK